MGGGGSTYDYGFRIYNRSIAKFLSVDPLFATYPEGSGGGSQPGGIRFYAEGASGSLLKAGNDLRVVQVFAGHKNLSATEKYKQAQLKELKRAVLNYHPLKSNPQIPKKR